MPIKKISSCQFRGLELSCAVGDIISSDTRGIGAICDSNFSLEYGLTRAIRDAAGDDFMSNLYREKRKQGSTAIAVPVTNDSLNANYVILCPARRSNRDSFDEIYNEFLNKAKELKLYSLTLPLLGTGCYGLTFDSATRFLKKAFTHFDYFGHLKKVQFIDRSEGQMIRLRDFLNNQLCSGETNTNRTSFNSSHSEPDISIVVFSDSSESSNNPGSSGTSANSNGAANNNGVASNGAANNKRNNIRVSFRASDDFNNSLHSNVRINTIINIKNLIDEDDDGDDSGEDIEMEDSFVDSDNDSDESISLDNSDLEEDSNEEENDDDISVDDISDISDSSEDEAATIQKFGPCDESVFWTIVTDQQLQQIGNSPQKPTTSTNSSKSASSLLDDTTLPCSICLCDMRDKLGSDNPVVQLSLCSHMFHLVCIRTAFNVKKQCPLCMSWYKDPIGYQPKDAKMTVRQIPGQVQGHKDAKGFHEITYYIPHGIQIQGHIRPGQSYSGMKRIAYLPNNKEGTLVLKLLQLAFKRRLIFTIGDSLTTGQRNVPIWNGIHHKIKKDGGPQGYGYPDPGYLSRVKEELAAVGVRSDQL